MLLNFLRRTLPLTLLALLFSFQPALAANIEVSGHVTASVEAPWPDGAKTLNVSGPDRGNDGGQEAAVVRAAFITEVEARGYAIDIAAPLDADLSWGGDFGRRQPGARPRFSLQAEGGNRSDTNFGLSLNLGPRGETEAGYLYVLSCRVVGAGGDVWHGQVEARTTEPVSGGETGKLAKLLWAELADAFGREVARRDFAATILLP